MSTRAFVLALLSATPCVGSAEAGEQGPPNRGRRRRPHRAHAAVSKSLAAHLRLDDSVDDILQHPAFAGFGRLLLPWDDRRYDHALPLRNIGSLLPYHEHVDPAVVVSALNRMVDDASARPNGLLRHLHRRPEAGGPVAQGHGPVLLPRQAGSSVCDHCTGWRVRVRGVPARGLPLRRRDQQPGIQRIRPEVSRGTRRRRRNSGSGRGDFLCLSKRAIPWRHDEPDIRCGAARRAPGWSRRSVPMGPDGLAARTCPSHRPS